MAETKEIKQHEAALPSNKDSGYAPVNGLNLYYETCGTNETDVPLILLHGTFGTVSMFDPILAALAKQRKVIAIELQGHGHTADIDRPITYEHLADDVSALIKCLGLGQADVLGYSLGGLVAQQVAIRTPKVVRKLVVCGSPCKKSGWYPEVNAATAAINAQMAKSWVGSPMHAAYARVAPKPDDWVNFVSKCAGVHSADWDWSSDVAKLKKPVLIVVGDADGVRTSHAVEFFELLGGGKKDGGWDGSSMVSSRLAILPATTHYNLLAYPALPSMVLSFLEAQ